MGQAPNLCRYDFQSQRVRLPWGAEAVAIIADFRN